MRDMLRRTIYNRSWVLDVMVCLLLVTTIFFLVGQRNLSEELTGIAKQNNELNHQNQDLLERVKSCTDPNGLCYKNNTAHTKDAVDSINKISVFAAACADEPGRQTVEQITACVTELLKNH